MSKSEHEVVRNVPHVAGARSGRHRSPDDDDSVDGVAAATSQPAAKSDDVVSDDAPSIAISSRLTHDQMSLP